MMKSYRQKTKELQQKYKRREQEDEAKEADKYERTEEHDKAFSKDERREKRVGSWRDFQSGAKKKRQRKSGFFNAPASKWERREDVASAPNTAKGEKYSGKQKGEYKMKWK